MHAGDGGPGVYKQGTGKATYRATLEPCPSARDLEADWRDLAARAAPNLFLAWEWIGTWLSLVPGHQLQLLRIISDDRLVGLALIGQSVVWQRPWPARTWHLNQSGHADPDSAYIEYNDILVDTAHADAARRLALETLRDHIRTARFDGLRHRLALSGSKPDLISAARQCGFQVSVQKDQPAPFVDLKHISTVDDYLATLSRNTAAQIRRAMRLYEEAGPLAARHAQTGAEVDQWLDELIDLHQKTWQGRGKQGAFARPFFAAFARALCHAGLSAGTAELIRVDAGNRIVGYLLNLADTGEVANYQAGFAYAEDNRLKPGLVTHTMAIARYAAEGRDRYSFLAGEDRYKQSLATGEDRLIWASAAPRHS